MAHYLITASYTGAAWAAQIENPQNRIEVVRPLFEKVGGEIESAFFAFGEDDLVLIVRVPDNVSMAAVALVASAGGGVANLKTTPLLSIEDGMSALQQAGSLTYTPPGS
ncbi:MAG: hypothetical protein CL897_00280 [Dehalococcoidia bacterium]|nr:hypothetical protein [Dehalococcoidia bacterium]HCU99637.1 hypothetical protein [Dehalococcoidia bacterium]|tara:strand:+ start:1277 stop:1603 length:327 start_codon:yes stop_codon:yes gene_type:complete